MKVYMVKNNQTFFSNVKDGAECIELGPQADLDDVITKIDWERYTYTTRRHGIRYIPENHYTINQLVWQPL